MSDQRRILIVDDDPHVAELVEVNLRSKGYAVSMASDGYGALAAIEKNKPDLVILDIMMPELDGWETCKIIKDNYGSDEIKIVILTAKDSARDMMIGTHIFKADAYLTKPFDIEELLSTIDGVLGGAA